MSGVKREGEEREDYASTDEKTKKPKTSQAVVSSCVLVTGVEYQDQALREKIKTLGASWCKPLSGWVLPESARAAALAVVSGAEPSEDDMKKVEKGAQSEDPPPSQNAGAKLCIAPHKKAIVVTGDTMKVKDTLKKLQGSWNKGLGGECLVGIFCKMARAILVSASREFFAYFLGDLLVLFSFCVDKLQLATARLVLSWQQKGASFACSACRSDK